MDKNPQYDYSKQFLDVQLPGGRKVDGRRSEATLVLLLSAAFFLVCTLRLWLSFPQGELYWIRGAGASAPPPAQSVQAEEPESILPGERINVNTAPPADLSRLPLIGEKRARAILDWREKNGSFRREGELLKVPGISREVFEEIREYITVSD